MLNLSRSLAAFTILITEYAASNPVVTSPIGPRNLKRNLPAVNKFFPNPASPPPLENKALKPVPPIAVATVPALVATNSVTFA